MKIRFLIITLIFFVVSAYAQPLYVATIHPLKQLLLEVVGERGTVESIMPPGASPHTFELKPSLLRRVNAATALFTGDEHLDNWSREFRYPSTIAMFRLLPAQYRLEIVGYVGKNRGLVYGDDPHFWTDPLTVKALLPKLAEELSKLDPPGKRIYEANAQRFGRQLDSLTVEMKAILNAANGKKVLLTHPFFQYFLKRFHIELAGIIESIPGTEPTPREILQMIKKVKKEQVAAILAHPSHSRRPAQLIAESTGIPIVVLDPLGGVPGRESYAEMLRFNAVKIAEAVGK